MWHNRNVLALLSGDHKFKSEQLWLGAKGINNKLAVLLKNMLLASSCVLCIG